MRVPEFKQINIYFFTSLILFTSCIRPTQINKSDRSKPAIEADKFDQRLSDLHQRIDTVAASLQQAEGLARTSGLIDLQVAKYFAEYIAFEFSPDAVADVAGVVKTLEQNHHMRWWPGLHDGVPLEMNWLPSRGAKPQADPGAEEAYATMQKVDARLTPQTRKSWRWRQLYLRALLDSELKTNGGSPNKSCNEAFAELIRIYHAENASGTVRPPLSK